MPLRHGKKVFFFPQEKNYFSLHNISTKAYLVEQRSGINVPQGTRQQCGWAKSVSVIVQIIIQTTLSILCPCSQNMHMCIYIYNAKQGAKPAVPPPLTVGKNWLCFTTIHCESDSSFCSHMIYFLFISCCVDE